MTTPPTPAQSLFDCRDVHYSYQGRFPALCGIDLAIDAGDRIALLGANGSGKSTLLSLLDGLIFPDRGTIAYAGKPLTEAAFTDPAFSLAFRRSVGLVFQNPDVQLFCPSVKEDLAFGPLQLGVDQETVKDRIGPLAETLGIARLLDRSPHQLSVGEKRKVAFATVLAIDPKVLLLDEPTAGLDPKTSTQLVAMLAQFAQAGKTVITATHDLHMIEDIADKVYVFGQDRRVAGHGRTVDVLQDGQLLRDNNLIHAHTHHSRDHRNYRLGGEAG